MTATTHYRLTLRPLPDGVPVNVRLRKALKTLLRAYRLRCVKLEELDVPVAERRPAVDATTTGIGGPSGTASGGHDRRNARAVPGP